MLLGVSESLNRLAVSSKLASLESLLMCKKHRSGELPSEPSREPESTVATSLDRALCSDCRQEVTSKLEKIKGIVTRLEGEVERRDAGASNHAGASG